MNEIYIDKWSSYTFSSDPKVFQLGRLCGYTKTDDGRIKFTVSEPITHIDEAKKLVTTADGTVYNLLEKMDASSAQKMDMLYSVGRWSEVHQNPSNRETSAELLEKLTDEKKND